MRSFERDVLISPTKDNRIRLAYARAIWLVETGAVEVPDVRSSIDSSGIVSIGYFNAYDFARGITAGAKTIESRLALAQLRARTEAALASAKGVTSDWHDNVTAAEVAQAAIMETALDGVIQYYEGDRAAGVAIGHVSWHSFLPARRAGTQSPAAYDSTTTHRCLAAPVNPNDRSQWLGDRSFLQ